MTHDKCHQHPTVVDPNIIVSSIRHTTLENTCTSRWDLIYLQVATENFKTNGLPDLARLTAELARPLCVHAPVRSRHQGTGGQMWPQIGQIGTKWDKSGTF